MPRARLVEAFCVLLAMIAVAVGGRAWLVDVARFHGFAVSALAVVGIVVIYAFRRTFLDAGPAVRLSATRDAALLAAIVAAIAFILAPARWSLGATVVALEFGLLVELARLSERFS